MPQHRSVGPSPGWTATVGEVPGRPAQDAVPRFADAEPVTEPLFLSPPPLRAPSPGPRSSSVSGRHAVVPLAGDDDVGVDLAEGPEAPGDEEQERATRGGSPDAAGGRRGARRETRTRQPGRRSRGAGSGHDDVPDDRPRAAAGHGHGHSPAAPAGRPVRLLLAALLAPFALAALVGLVLLRPTGGPPPTAEPLVQQPVRGQVTATEADDCAEGDGKKACTAVTVHLEDGPRAGNDLVQVVPREPGTPVFAVDDPVVVSWSGGDPDDPTSYQLVDFQRGASLGWLAALFAAAVLILGRWRGLASLAALGVGFLVLLEFVLPAILSGRNPLAVAVVGAGVIMFAVLYLTHGLSARTSTAVIGTLVSLALIGVLGAAFSAAARLTGLDDQTNALITSLGTGVDARGLLLAGMVIGALGVLDDVTVTQTSAVWELRAANPRLGTSRLFRSAMRIGRDHVASAVNTLVLAYAGAALPLLLLFQLSGRSLGEVATSQDVAMEIVRTLVGSIGLVASVPITTAVAALVASREEPAPGSPPDDGGPGRGSSPHRRPRGAAARPGLGTLRAALPALRGRGRGPRRTARAR
jgi:uncharacterized membrane protein